MAEDGSETQLEKVLPLAEARQVPWRTAGGQEELGAAVGSGPLTVVGVTEPGFATGILERLRREK